MVMEYLGMGSLYNLLVEKRQELQHETIVSIFRGISAGMLHLHKENLIHRDLASRNVLLQRLDDRIIPKISDFGYSRFVENIEGGGKTASATGPLKWMAPESLASKVYSKKTDVWSFGVVMWEVINRSIPFPDLDAFTAGSQVAFKRLTLSLPNKSEWPIERDIMQRCFLQDQESRPNFDIICQMFAPSNP